MSSLFNYASSIYHIYQAILTHFLSHFPQFLSFYILLCDFLYFFCPFGVRCNVRYVSKQVLLLQDFSLAVTLAVILCTFGLFHMSASNLISEDIYMLEIAVSGSQIKAKVTCLICELCDLLAS